MEPTMMLGIASGALNLLGGMSQRRAQQRAAQASYESNFAFINRDNAVTMNDLMLNAGGISDELGMQLTGLAQEMRQATSTAAVAQTERNVFGNTAERVRNVIETKGALSADALTQAAEAKMVDAQNQMRTQKYNYERQHAENAQAYSNKQAQMPSTLGIVAGAAAAGANTYSMAMNLEASKSALDIRRSMRDLAQQNAQATGARLSRLINLGN